MVTHFTCDSQTAGSPLLVESLKKLFFNRTTCNRTQQHRIWILSIVWRMAWYCSHACFQ